eukprot:scaffold17854_cov182-Amphora_coffeaeformis.AAC.1
MSVNLTTSTTIMHSILDNYPPWQRCDKLIMPPKTTSIRCCSAMASSWPPRNYYLGHQSQRYRSMAENAVNGIDTSEVTY